MFYTLTAISITLFRINLTSPFWHRDQVRLTSFESVWVSPPASSFTIYTMCSPVTCGGCAASQGFVCISLDPVLGFPVITRRLGMLALLWICLLQVIEIECFSSTLIRCINHDKCIRAIVSREGKRDIILRILSCYCSRKCTKPLIQIIGCVY